MVTFAKRWKIARAVPSVIWQSRPDNGQNLARAERSEEKVREGIPWVSPLVPQQIIK